MGTNLTLAPYAAQGDWHLILPRYILCAHWARGKRILDLVCGRGIGCEILRRAGATQIVGVDTRDEVVGWANDHLSSHTVSFHTLQRGAPLPFVDHSFDMIIALNPTRGLGRSHYHEIRRVLEYSGTLVITEPAGPQVTLAEFLPYFDRDPIGEASEPADVRFLVEIDDQLPRSERREFSQRIQNRIWPVSELGHGSRVVRFLFTAKPTPMPLARDTGFL